MKKYLTTHKVFQIIEKCKKQLKDNNDWMNDDSFILKFTSADIELWCNWNYHQTLEIGFTKLSDGTYIEYDSSCYPEY